jgi:3-deoxy-D-manno-octulosonate 8-phosphate phosphatase (KDO 8-P phosphatase)
MMNLESNWIPKNLILDVDGVFTDGKIYQSEEGKLFKVFGPDDHDALNIIKKKLQVTVVSADTRGFEITKRRIEIDMGLDLYLVGSQNRVEWIANRFDLNDCVYMGDGIYDPLVFRAVKYSLAPANASRRTQSEANYVTSSRGSEGAVAEACIHLLERFFGGFEVTPDQIF